MATLRELKGRIGSVASSEKITGAMKMISSAKMHKAEMSLRQLQPFRKQIEGIIGHLLSTDAEFKSPLIEARDVHHVTIVVWGSDDGLCGAYNVNIYKQLIDIMATYRKDAGKRLTIIPIGKKMYMIVSKLKLKGVDVSRPEGIDSKSAGEDVNRFVRSLIDSFVSGDTDQVDMLYMRFVSAGRQKPTHEMLLPLESETFSANGVVESNRPYIFEPDPNTIFNSVLPMFLQSLGHDVFTENRASEQAARIMAMQSANDNAKKLLEQLQLEYNKLRQQSITTELLDILGGQVK